MGDAAGAAGGKDAGGAAAERPAVSATQVPELEFSVIFPRRKTVNANGKGCDGEPVFVTREFITPYFKMPMVAACAELGVCPTAMKKACRKLGIVKWPYRRTVVALRNAKPAGGPEHAELVAQGGPGQLGGQQQGGQGSEQMQAHLQMQRQQQHAQHAQQQQLYQWQQLKQMQQMQMQMQQQQMQMQMQAQQQEALARHRQQEQQRSVSAADQLQPHGWSGRCGEYLSEQQQRYSQRQQPQGHSAGPDMATSAGQRGCCCHAGVICCWRH